MKHTLFKYISGSNLYGLNRPDSDIDYRSVFINKDPLYVFRFYNKETNVTNNKEIDLQEFEIVHFFRQLEKGGTTALEGLFSPKSSHVYVEPIFNDLVLNHKYRFLDTEKMLKSFQGYIHSEYRLATGDRTGQLGSKRKDALDLYGFSPKNFCNLFRLMGVMTRYLETGIYVCFVKDISPDLFDLCYSLRTNPEKYETNELKKTFEHMTDILEKAKQKSPENIMHRKFDYVYAGNVLKQFYNKFM